MANADCNFNNALSDVFPPPRFEHNLQFHQIQCYKDSEIISFLDIQPHVPVKLEEVYNQMIPPNNYDEIFTLTVTTGDAYINDESAKMCQGTQIGDSMEFSTYRTQGDAERRLYDHRVVTGISLLPWEDNYIGPHEVVDQGGVTQQVKVETILTTTRI